MNGSLCREYKYADPTHLYLFNFKQANPNWDARICKKPVMCMRNQPPLPPCTNFINALPPPPGNPLFTRCPNTAILEVDFPGQGYSCVRDGLVAVGSTEAMYHGRAQTSRQTGLGCLSVCGGCCLCTTFCIHLPNTTLLNTGGLTATLPNPPEPLCFDVQSGQPNTGGGLVWGVQYAGSTLCDSPYLINAFDHQQIYLDSLLVSTRGHLYDGSCIIDVSLSYVGIGDTRYCQCVGGVLVDGTDFPCSSAPGPLNFAFGISFGVTANGCRNPDDPPNCATGVPQFIGDPGGLAGISVDGPICIECLEGGLG